MVSITHDRWLQAQEAERGYHKEDFDTGRAHYADSYRQYFSHVGKPGNPTVIVEIGPADFPALAYVEHLQGSLIIEPMPSDYLKRFNIPIITEPAETAIYEADEVWLFNVLQHVINPGEIVERAKKQAKMIRFFEPINTAINDAHPWSLTMGMFKEWFGDCVVYYPANPGAVNFHTAECAYGVWHRV